MSDLQPKIIGTVNLEENNNMSTSLPWEPVTTPKIPFSVITPPQGFLFVHGSACGSLPTTSLEGYTYVSDTYIFRQDGNNIDTDRYIGSITQDNFLALLKIPSEQNPYHHLKPTDLIITNLTPNWQQQVKTILEKQDGS